MAISPSLSVSNTPVIFRRHVLNAVLACAAIAVASGSASADPLNITVSRTDSSFTPLQSVTLNTGALTPAFQSNATLSPGMCTLYNLFFSLGLSDPFAGTGVSWSVTGNTNAPGTTAEGLLQTSNTTAFNPSSVTYYMQVIVDSGDYVLPGADASHVLATAVFSNSGVSDALAGLESYIDSSLIGTASFSGPQTVPSATIGYTRGSSYRLTNIFDITLFGHSSSDPASNTNITVNTQVTPNPEPWNLQTCIAMALSVGLMFCYFQRRKHCVSR